MALAVLILGVVVALLAAWCGRLDYLLAQVLEREADRVEADAEALRVERIRHGL